MLLAQSLRIGISSSALIASGALSAGSSGSSIGTSAGVSSGEIMPHKYWRLLVTNANSTQFSLAELEMRDVGGGDSLCVGGTATASSIIDGNPTYNADKAFDNDGTTFWTPASSSLPQWISYEFSSDVAIREIVLKNRDDSTFGSYMILEADVQYSDDGVIWVTEWSITTDAWSTQEARVFNPEGRVHYSFYRLKINSDGGSTTTTAAVNGLEFYNDATGKNIIKGGSPKASGSLSSSYPAKYAFDSLLLDNSGADRIWATNDAEPWIGYEFTKDVELTSIGLWGREANYYNQNPTSFDVQKSVDGGVTWETLWSVTGLTWSEGFEFKRLDKSGYTYPASIGAHKYWRLYVLRTFNPTGNDGAPGIAELEFKKMPDGSDLAVGGTATASSSYSSTYNASKAFDDNTSTLWASNSHLSEWIAYEFTSEVEIHALTITARNDSFYKEAPKLAAVQWSDDGKVWTTAWRNNDTETWAQGGTHTITDPNITPTYRYWRLYGITYSGNPSFYEIQFREEVSGPSVVNEGTPFASTELSGFEAVLAFDNNVATRWAANGTLPPHFIGIDFGDGNEKWIKEIAVDEFSSQTFRKFLIQASNDDVDYQNIWYNPETLSPNVLIEIENPRPQILSDNGGHLYWRIRGLTGTGTNAQYQEVEFRSTVGGSNEAILASGGIPIASSFYNGSFFPDFAFDGDTNTVWAAKTEVVGAWIGYQFLDNIDIVEVALNANNTENWDSAVVEYSDDGETWVTSWTISSITGATGTLEVYSK